MLRYLFVDMNSYFASVEQQAQPRLRDQPIAIVPVKAMSTCCIAASYEAKAFGVKTGTGVRDALQRCPRLQLVEARPELYVQYHHRIIDAVESCLHVDQVCSIDEMYGRLLGDERQPHRAASIAHDVKAAIREKVGPYVRCSIGVATNVWLAKVASDMQKPDGMTMLRPEQLPEAIEALQLDDLPGIGRRMLQRLHRRGIRHVHDLYQRDVRELSKVWHSTVMGSIWWHQLRGYDMPFRSTVRRSVGHSHVLPPELRTTEGAHRVIVRMIHKAAARLRRLRYHAGELTVSVRLLEAPRWRRRAALGDCRDTLTMLQAFEALWRERPWGQPSKVAVVLTKLTPDTSAGLLGFPEQIRRDALAVAMDRLDRKYGRHTLYFGGMMGAQHAAPTRIAFTQIPDASEFE